jgi:hypothetical protein
MNEDRMRNRLDHGPYNLAIPRHMAIDVMQEEGSKGSLRGKFKRAGWQDAYLRKLPRMFRCAIALGAGVFGEPAGFDGTMLG